MIPRRVSTSKARLLKGPGLACVLLLGMNACSSTSGQVCDASYAYITVPTIDTAGAPLGGASVSDRVIRTGDVFSVNQEPVPAGTATVFSDSYIAKVQPQGDSVEVTTTLGARSNVSGFRFASNGCHVSKISGPDTLALR